MGCIRICTHHGGVCAWGCKSAPSQDPERDSGSATSPLARRETHSINHTFITDAKLKTHQYAVKDYISALKFVQVDKRVLALGLVNFDTERVEEIVASGLKVVSNQIQVILHRVTNRKYLLLTFQVLTH
jgi:diketogulonate reductase-like aldo/keto reductase